MQRFCSTVSLVSRRVHAASGPRTARLNIVLPLIVAATHCISSTFAQSPVVPKRDLPIVPKAGELDILRTVATPPAATAVVSDVAKVLVVGLKPKVPTNKEKQAGVKMVNGPHLMFFRLDDKGEPTTAAVSIDLPTSKQFVDRQNFPLSLAAHPKLPLLYVWQDVQPPAEGAKPDDVKNDGFQHLHVYDLSSAEPKLVQSIAGGETYARGNAAGAIDFDRTASRLFVPNMQRPVKSATGVMTMTPSIGYLRVLDDGLVVPNEEETADVAQGGKGTTADRTGAVSLAARKQYLEQVRTGKVLDRAVRYATAATSTFAGFPAGLGFYNINDTTTIVCGALGPVTWDEANRRAQFNSIAFYPIVGIGYRYRMVAHPTIPVVFFTGVGYAYIFRMEHVDGFMTMLPQRGFLNGITINSPPVLLGNRKVLACGSPEKLHLVDFDDAGNFSGQRTDVPVAGSAVEALTYSPKFDRLYTTVAEGKK